MQPEIEDHQQHNKEKRPSRNPNGRPPKLKPDDETLKQINGLARIQCTQREAAAVLGVHRQTFSDFLNTYKKAMEAWEDGQDQGRASIRRMQYKAAESGNVTMQIWLGKQMLDQRDRTAIQHSGDQDNPVSFLVASGVPTADDDDQWPASSSH
jgi:hypothetical protein